MRTVLFMANEQESMIAEFDIQTGKIFDLKLQVRREQARTTACIHPRTEHQNQRQPTNQPTDQPTTNQSTNAPTNPDQPTDSPANKPTDHQVQQHRAVELRRIHLFFDNEELPDDLPVRQTGPYLFLCY
jgi:hypothetical protein